MNKDFLLESYDYVLPPELIAQEPSYPAHNAKLLIVEIPFWGLPCQEEKEEQSDRRGVLNSKREFGCGEKEFFLDKDSSFASLSQNDLTFYDQSFFDVKDMLGEDDILLCNQTKVFKARIPLQQVKVLRRSGMEKIIDGEVFVYRLIDSQHVECLVSDDKNFKPGAEIFFEDGISMKSIEYTDDGILFEVKGMKSLTFLEKFGQMPLPPYITYEKEKEQWYQTYFAEEIGSAAAPTASLHFTEELLGKLKEKNVGIEFLTLHVGLGTFKPVYVENIRDHPIHQETMIVDWEIFEKIAKWKKEKKNLIPVGTTMVRFLETLPYLRKALNNTSETILSLRRRGTTEVISNTHKLNIEPLEIASSSLRSKGQGPYTEIFWNELTKDISLEECEKYIKEFSVQKNFISVETKLFIYPGFTFRIIDQMITNFHLPKSSLLMLVSALVGRENALQMYEYAIEHGYTFYSFGDGMWIKTLSQNR